MYRQFGAIEGNLILCYFVQRSLFFRAQGGSCVDSEPELCNKNKYLTLILYLLQKLEKVE